MAITAFSLAVVALVFALQAAAKSKAFDAKIEEVARSSRREIDRLENENIDALKAFRRQLASVVEGKDITPEMILEGRLWQDVDVRRGAEMVEQGSLHILDVRTPQETSMGIIPGAQLIPVDQLEERLNEVARDGQPTLIYCAGGGRSAAACEFLSQQGLDGLFNLDGGFSSWTGPSERPQSK